MAAHVAELVVLLLERRAGRQAAVHRGGRRARRRLAEERLPELLLGCTGRGAHARVSGEAARRGGASLSLWRGGVVRVAPLCFITHWTRGERILRLRSCSAIQFSGSSATRWSERANRWIIFSESSATRLLMISRRDATCRRLGSARREEQRRPRLELEVAARGRGGGGAARARRRRRAAPTTTPCGSGPTTRRRRAAPTPAGDRRGRARQPAADRRRRRREEREQHRDGLVSTGRIAPPWPRSTRGAGRAAATRTRCPAAPTRPRRAATCATTRAPISSSPAAPPAAGT